jgi:hypothetical protein
MDFLGLGVVEKAEHIATDSGRARLRHVDGGGCSYQLEIFEFFSIPVCDDPDLPTATAASYREI